MIMIIKCEGIPTGMRFCDQTQLNTYAYEIENIVSVNLNQFSVGYPFTLTGNQYLVKSEQLKHIKFYIVDIYNNPIEFTNDIIWTFSLEKLE